MMRPAYTAAMNAPMARAEKSKPTARRYVSAANPNVEPIVVRMPKALRDALKIAVDDLNAAAAAAGDPRKWTRNDLVVSILTRELRDRKPGDLP